MDIWMTVLPFIKGRVLDLGCGPCVLYKDTDIDLTGVDWSEEALKKAKENYPRGTYICSDLLATNLIDKSYDTIVMLGVLDYFEDWELIMKEARRLKRDDGKIIATLLNGFNGHDWTQYKHVTGNWYLYAE